MFRATWSCKSQDVDDKATCRPLILHLYLFLCSQYLSVLSVLRVLEVRFDCSVSFMKTSAGQMVDMTGGLSPGCQEKKHWKKENSMVLQQLITLKEELLSRNHDKLHEQQPFSK